MNDHDMYPDTEEQNNSPSEISPENEPVINPVLAAFLGLAGVFFLYHIVGSLISLLILGFDIQNADVNALRLLTMAGQLLFILLPTLLLAKFIYKDVSSIIRFRLPRFIDALIFILGFIILTFLIQEILFVQNYLFEELAKSSSFFQTLKSFLDELDQMINTAYNDLLTATNAAEYILVVVVVSVIPALCEEIFFRGYVQKSLEKKMSAFWAIVLTSVIFGMYHFNPMGLIALSILGLYFGYSAYATNSILIPIILHFLNNFSAVVLFFIYGNEDLSDLELMSEMGIVDHLTALLFFTGVFVLFIYLVQKKYAKTTTEGATS